MTRWLLLAFRKQNLLITTHILLLLWLNGAVLLMSSFSQSSSRLFFNQSSYISPFVPTAVFVLKRKTQSLVYSDSLVTCPCPSSFSRGLIHLHERQQGISDSYCGSVDRFSALWAWVCCVCDCVWETEGGGELWVCGGGGVAWGGETPGASQCPWWKQPESSRPASLLKSELQDVVSLLNSLWMQNYFTDNASKNTRFI